jgi:N-acetyl-anhydromuramyl-L-alanine amidase AmpD
MVSVSWWRNKAAWLARGGSVLALLAGGCATAPTPPKEEAKPRVVYAPPPPPPPVIPLPHRTGDEILVAGQWFHTGTRVVTWLDRGGYNGYLVKTPPGVPPSYTARRLPAPNQPGPPTFAELQGIVDQFVLHYDGGGLSGTCFAALRERGLSVHFMLDLDGTIYQTLDLRERALHATIANNRSIGIEIANVGAYAPGNLKTINAWYRKDAFGKIRLVPPQAAGNPGFHAPGFVARPERPALVQGKVQGRELVQYDYTPEQYKALIRLTAALCRIFPGLKCDYPHDADGRLIREKLPDRVLENYHGILGHYHIQTNKIDPGPAFQWDLLVEGARRLNP